MRGRTGGEYTRAGLGGSVRAPPIDRGYGSRAEEWSRGVTENPITAGYLVAERETAQTHTNVYGRSHTYIHSRTHAQARTRSRRRLRPRLRRRRRRRRGLQRRRRRTAAHSYTRPAAGSFIVTRGASRFHNPFAHVRPTERFAYLESVFCARFVIIIHHKYERFVQLLQRAISHIIHRRRLCAVRVENTSYPIPERYTYLLTDTTVVVPKYLPTFPLFV